MSVVFSEYPPAHGVVKPSSELLKTVAFLCQAFQGNFELKSALGETCRLIGADVASVCRIDFKNPLSAPQVVSYDEQLRRLGNDRDFDFALAPDICGNNMRRAKSGSTWFGTLDDVEENEALFKYLLNRKLSESVSILLERKSGTADFLELHFCHPVSCKTSDALEVLGPVLSDIWKKRALGRFSEAKLTAAHQSQVKAQKASILSIENPCQLSRSEYRVCLLLAQGLNNTALLDELSITISTLRTHLRNIYLKTGTRSQTELVHDLLSSAVYGRSGSSDQSRVA